MRQSKPSSRNTCSFHSTHRLDSGVHLMAATVATTYGPRGRCVALDRAVGPLWTRDGALVLWELLPEHPAERAGVRLVQAACHQVASQVGDGTTTTALLISSLLREGRKRIAAGADPWALSEELRRLDWGDSLQQFASETTSQDVLNVALHASHGDMEIAEAVSKALDLVGSKGLVVVEEGKGRGVELLPKRGYILDRGWESSDFGPNSRRLDSPLVALVDAELTRMEEVTPILEEATRYPHPLVIISRGTFAEALKTLVINDRKLERASGPLLEVVAIRAPTSQREQAFRDFEALAGARRIPWKGGTWDPSWFGGLRSADIGYKRAVLVGADDAVPRIESRLSELSQEILRAATSLEKEQAQKRLAMLSDGLCVLRVGSHSETELKERKGRVEDALRAAQAATETGVVPMGLWPDLARATGWDGFWKPAETVDPDARIRKPKNEAFFWDIRQDTWVDPWEEGLIEPVGVLQIVLEVACSTVAEILLSSLVITRS